MSIQDSDNNNISDRVYGGTGSASLSLENKTIVSASLYITNGTVFYNYTVGSQLEQGSTATSYEPYVGGTASPNSSYPQTINNVTGDVEVVVQNKNLFDKENANVLNANLDGGVVNVISNSRTVWIKCKPNTAYVISKLISQQFQVGTTETEPQSGTTLMQLTGTKTTVGDREYIVLITNATANYLLCRYVNIFQDDDETIRNTIMIEQNSTSTNYVPHKEQTFIFPLGNEKLMLGDYLADDGKQHIRKQKIFDGSESWYAYTDKNTQSYYCYYTNAPSDCIAAQEEANLVKCNVLPESTWDDIYGKRHDTPIIALRNNKRFYVRVPFATLVEWEAYITQQYTNETPVIVEYKLAQNETIPYTSAQQTAYNQIKQALSYESQTNIFGLSNGSNPVFDVEAYQSTKLVLEERDAKYESLEARVALLE